MPVLLVPFALIASSVLANPVVDRDEIHRAAFMARMPSDIVDKKITKEELSTILSNPIISDKIQGEIEEEVCSEEESREKREIHDEIRDETAIPIMSQPGIRPIKPILIGN